MLPEPDPFGVGFRVGVGSTQTVGNLRINWWIMADVEAMLFPSRRPQDEDAPEGLNPLPNTFHAQESLH
jgi:hypothetical protein